MAGFERRLKASNPTDEGLLKKAKMITFDTKYVLNGVGFAGRTYMSDIYAILPFFSTTGRIYAAPTHPPARRCSIAVEPALQSFSTAPVREGSLTGRIALDRSGGSIPTGWDLRPGMCDSSAA